MNKRSFANRIYPSFLAGAAALVLGGVAFAQEFFLYPPCNARVEGTLRAQASIAATAGVRIDRDEHVLDQRFPITDASQLQFFGGGPVAAGVRALFDDLGCRTGALASASGRMRYNFRGDGSTMRLAIGSLNDQRDIIRRDPTSAGLGGLVSARSIFDLAGHNQMRVHVPFSVGGGDGGVIHADLFTLRRTDSGPSGGSSSAFWFVHADLNGNCEIDQDEPEMASGSLSVGPNERAAADPIRFAAPRGHYVLSLTKETSSDVGVDSPGCDTSVRAASQVLEVMTLVFTLT